VTVDDVLAEAEAFCAGFEKGTITVGPDVVQSVELTGDDTPETIIDYKGICLLHDGQRLGRDRRDHAGGPDRRAAV
jgi:hypothetical protein